MELLLDERQRVLVDLLDRWRDFFDEPGGEPAALNENAEDQIQQELKNFTAFSSMAREPVVVEMKRCVDLLERLGSGRRGDKVPVHHRHLMAYTARVEWRIVKGFEMRRVGSQLVPRIDAVTKQAVVDPDPKKMRRERIVPPWVDLRIVGFALDVVLGTWDRRVALELPLGLRKGLREYVNAETGEVGWTQAA